MLFSPVPVLFIPLFPLYCFVLLCLVSFSLLTAFPLKIVFLRLCSKLRQLPEWYQVLPFCHVSPPVPPSLSWLWALWVLCDQFFLFFFSPTGGGCLPFFCLLPVLYFSSSLTWVSCFLSVFISLSQWLQPPVQSPTSWCLFLLLWMESPRFLDENMPKAVWPSEIKVVDEVNWISDESFDSSWALIRSVFRPLLL